MPIRARISFRNPLSAAAVNPSASAESTSDRAPFTTISVRRPSHVRAIPVIASSRILDRIDTLTFSMLLLLSTIASWMSNNALA